MAEKSEDELLFREIDEELRQDQVMKLWRAYGKYAVAAVAALVLGVAGFQGWRAYDVSQRKELSRRFETALELADKKNTEDALQAFAGIAKDGGGYGMLARFQEARLLASRGDAAGAAAAYRNLAADGDVDDIYRQLATVLGALQELNLSETDLGGLEARLQPLAADTSPWRFSAREILALVARRAGDTAKADDLLTKLAADPTAPQGVRQRAQEMLSIQAP